MIYNIEIPVPDYDADRTFNASVLVDSNHIPTREEVLDILEYLDEKYKSEPLYDGVFWDTMSAMHSTEEFPDETKAFVQCTATNGLEGFIYLSVPEIHQLNDS